MVETSQQPAPADASPSGRAKNPFFALLALTATVFIITILALIAVPYGDPRAPVAKWLDRYGGRLIGAEILVFVIASTAALVVDRRQTLRDRSQSDSTAPSSSPHESDSP